MPKTKTVRVADMPLADNPAIYEMAVDEFASREGFVWADSYLETEEVKLFVTEKAHQIEDELTLNNFLDALLETGVPVSGKVGIGQAVALLNTKNR